MNETEAKPTAEQLLLNACRDAKFRDKWIYPVGGAPHQNWLLQVYVPVPEDAKDRTPEGCLRAVLAAQPAPAEPVNREHAIALRDAELCGCEDMYFAARPQIDTLQARRIYAAGFKAGYEVRPPAQPLRAEPVALESVHLTRDIKGMCTVRVNGRVAIQDNGDIIDHMATLEWFAQPAPVPLTEGRITAIANELAYAGGLCNVYEFARAIERAHGIGGSNG